MNSKNKLQELCQKNSMGMPHYHSIENRNGFKSIVKLENIIYEGTWALTKKESEMKCASVALEQLEKSIIEKPDELYELLDNWINNGYRTVLILSGFKDNNNTKYLLTCAFIHSSFKEKISGKYTERKLGEWLGYKENESFELIDQKSLAVFGDSMIKYQQTRSIWNTELNKNKCISCGEITKKRSLIENNKFFVTKMIENGLDQFVMHFGNDIKNTTILADTLEAFIGAITHISESNVKSVMSDLGLFGK